MMIIRSSLTSEYKYSVRHSCKYLESAHDPGVDVVRFNTMMIVRSSPTSECTYSVRHSCKYLESP